MFVSVVLTSLLGLAQASPWRNINLPRKIHNVEILSISTTYVQNYTSDDLSSIAPTNVSAIDFCNVTVTLTHPHEDDFVVMSIWLPPAERWNGNYLATGGGGLIAGYFASRQGPGVALGYATASTDAGLAHDTVNQAQGSWALKSDGSPNTALLTNFAYRSIHDMNVLGKAIIREYYGVGHRYSYYHGCSTGGRQGYLSAMYYPDDFDGILAISPAIHTPEASPADFWPSVVMGNSVAPPQCVFNAYEAAIVAACDYIDGAVDGLLSTYNPDACDFDPTTLVGKSIECSDTNTTITITPADADIVRKCLRGPTDENAERLWYGIPPGASFSGLANTAIVNGTVVARPFEAAEAWIKYFIFQDADYPAASMTYRDFADAFSLSVEKFSPQFGTLHPDLDGFRKAGAKLLTWHGLADEYIPPAGTTRFYDTVLEEMGGKVDVGQFYRVFLAPGAAHCSGGYGPVPTDPWGALTSWVENANAPEYLLASTVDARGKTVSRNLCPYPSSLVYRGGDVDEASSFACEAP